ncbi:hypothetical protein SDC9_123110 [bioreactor metagenome]|uniref:Uncharacterized protein n=1 Tax=bioreactor metagenome TaxID=1076179 RepID=A0A645CGR2_9ZZZZ
MTVPLPKYTAYNEDDFIAAFAVKHTVYLHRLSEVTPIFKFL